MDSRKWKVLGVFFLILLVSAGGMQIMINKNKKKEAPPIEKLRKAVVTEKTAFANVETEVQGLGRVQSLQKVDVIAEVSGKILAGNVAFKKGERFKKGDVLARIYANDFKYSLLSRKSRFLNMIANILPDIKIDFPDRYAVWETFFQTIKIDASLPEIPEFEDQKEKIFVSSKNILSEYYGIKSDEERLMKYTIYAPFDGYLTTVNLEAGSVVNPGSRLGQIIRTGKLELEVPISSDDVDLININDIAIIKKGNKVIANGRVTRKTGYIDAATQSLNVFVVINDRQIKLYEGEYYQVIFPEKVFANAMVIPRNAVFNTNEVFVVKDSCLKIEPVNVLKVNDKNLLFNGIEEGLDIVVEPLVNVKEGTAVILSDKKIANQN